MYKKLLIASLFLFTACFFSFSISKVTAADTTDDTVTQQFYCLDAKQIPGTHRATVKNEDNTVIPNGNKNYILQIIQTDVGPVATTGNPDLDAQAGINRCVTTNPCQTGYQYLRSKYMLDGAKGPYGIFQSDGTTKVAIPFAVTNGKVGPYIISTETLQATDKEFKLLQIGSTKSTTGVEGGQQQGTFTLKAVDANCTVVKWDPFGRVFDSKSLEPIQNVKISLFEVKGGNTSLYQDKEGTVQNPSLPTFADGWFSFIVPTGFYKMEVSLPLGTDGNPSHKFPSDVKTVPTNKYKDLYYGETFEETAGGTHKDIPLDPFGAPYTSEIVKDYTSEFDPNSSSQIIRGKVSHPLTTINVFGVKADGTKTDELARTEPDDKGRFEIKITKAMIEGKSVVSYEVNFQKIKPESLTRKSLSEKLVSYISNLVKPVSAAASDTATFSVGVIPNYLEGYAYDNAGKVISNAKVGVYLSFSQNPYFQTTTDQNGYFKITSDYLPTMPYDLKFTSVTGAVITQPTTQFLQKNQSIVLANNINPYQYVNKNGQKSSPPPGTTVSREPYAKTSPSANEGKNIAQNPSGGTGGNTIGGQPINDTTNQNFMLLIVVVILLVIGVAGTLVTVYVMKKRNSETSDSGMGM